jgi:hypothetical protein
MKDTMNNAMNVVADNVTPKMEYVDGHTCKDVTRLQSFFNGRYI